MAVWGPQAPITYARALCLLLPSEKFLITSQLMFLLFCEKKSIDLLDTGFNFLHFELCGEKDSASGVVIWQQADQRVPVTDVHQAIEHHQVVVLMFSQKLLKFTTGVSIPMLQVFRNLPADLLVHHLEVLLEPDARWKAYPGAHLEVFPHTTVIVQLPGQCRLPNAAWSNDGDDSSTFNLALLLQDVFF